MTDGLPPDSEEVLLFFLALFLVVIQSEQIIAMIDWLFL